jgi:hypothetical protein
MCSRKNVCGFCISEGACCNLPGTIRRAAQRFFTAEQVNWDLAEDCGVPIKVLVRERSVESCDRSFQTNLREASFKGADEVKGCLDDCPMSTFCLLWEQSVHEERSQVGGALLLVLIRCCSASGVAKLHDDGLERLDDCVRSSRRR